MLDFLAWGYCVSNAAEWLIGLASKWSEAMGEPWVAFFHELAELQKSSSEMNLNKLKRVY